MAVQQNRKSSSKRDQRRAHDGLPGSSKIKLEKSLRVNETTGEKHRPHHLTPNGYDRKGRQVIAAKESSADTE